MSPIDVQLASSAISDSGPEVSARVLFRQSNQKRSVVFSHIVTRTSIPSSRRPDYAIVERSLNSKITFISAARTVPFAFVLA